MTQADDYHQTAEMYLNNAEEVGGRIPDLEASHLQYAQTYALLALYRLIREKDSDEEKGSGVEA